MRQKWMWKNNNDKADQWVNPSYGKWKKRRFCIHKRCVCDEIPMYQLSKTVGSVFQNPKSQFFNLDTDSELTFAVENQGYLKMK